MARVVSCLRGLPGRLGLGGNKAATSVKMRFFNPVSALNSAPKARATERQYPTVSLRSAIGIEVFRRFAFVAFKSHHGAFGGYRSPILPSPIAPSAP
jgi:hypothetical protein